jgi:biopolymer transport protein ExbD
MAGSQNIGEASDNPVAINVTAMVDVIFCLCIFFMCSFHFKQLEGKIDSWLPKDRGIFNNDPAFDNNLVKEEIRIIMRWQGGETKRKVLRSDQDWVRSDQELVQQIVGMAEGYNKVNNKTYPLIIDSDGDVPWRDVVHVMDLCRQNKIERIEFGAPEQEITPTARPGSG